MREYRFLILNSDQSIADSKVAAFADDAEALMYARRLDGPHDVEIWQDDRIVFRLAATRS